MNETTITFFENLGNRIVLFPIGSRKPISVLLLFRKERGLSVLWFALK